MNRRIFFKSIGLGLLMAFIPVGFVWKILHLNHPKMTRLSPWPDGYVKGKQYGRAVTFDVGAEKYALRHCHEMAAKCLPKNVEYEIGIVQTQNPSIKAAYWYSQYPIARVGIAMPRDKWRKDWVETGWVTERFMA